VLTERRAAVRGPGVGHGRAAIAEGEIRWCTFAGALINVTVRYALDSLDGNWKVVSRQPLVKVRSEN
jgi:hypothetical protein